MKRYILGILLLTGCATPSSQTVAPTHPIYTCVVSSDYDVVITFVSKDILSMGDAEADARGQYISIARAAGIRIHYTKATCEITDIDNGTKLNIKGNKIL